MWICVLHIDLFIEVWNMYMCLGWKWIHPRSIRWRKKEMQHRHGAYHSTTCLVFRWTDHRFRCQYCQCCYDLTSKVSLYWKRFSITCTLWYSILQFHIKSYHAQLGLFPNAFIILLNFVAILSWSKRNIIRKILSLLCWMVRHYSYYYLKLFPLNISG